MKYVTKHITIRDDQEKWIYNNNINLSRLVQKAIDKIKKKR